MYAAARTNCWKCELKLALAHKSFTIQNTNISRPFWQDETRTVDRKVLLLASKIFWGYICVYWEAAVRSLDLILSIVECFSKESKIRKNQRISKKSVVLTKRPPPQFEQNIDGSFQQNLNKGYISLLGFSGIFDG